MKILIGYPPNINELKKHFAIRPDVIFTYGDTIYNPGGGPINKALLIHEGVHSIEQLAMGVELWWEKYLVDPHFRCEQEVWAYREQYKEYKKSHGYKQSEIFLNSIAQDLSSALYGNIIDFKQALKEIRN